MIVREARRDDASALLKLISELGFGVDLAGVAERITRLATSGEPVLVADHNGAAVGMLNWHVMHTIHRAQPIGRIVALVVAEHRRGHGIGRMLVEHAERRMTEAGCQKIEVTSNLRLTDAHRFYERLGLERSSYRFAKDL